VDEAGKPLAGAVVLSEDGPDFWWWDLGASVVGNTGGVALANWVTPHTVYIFHKDYHTALGSSIENGLAKLYPKEEPGNAYVHETKFRIDEDDEGRSLPFASDICTGVTLSYDSKEEILEVASNDNKLYPSDQFFFLGSAEKLATKIISGHDRQLNFYCRRDDSTFEKFSIYVRGKVIIGRDSTNPDKEVNHTNFDAMHTKAYTRASGLINML
jgi:hypothetical protein